MDRVTPTYGGYSNKYVIDEKYALKVNATGDLRASLRCCVPELRPIRRSNDWKVGPGKKVAVAGLGGLGHMGVKIAAAMGAEVTVLQHVAVERRRMQRGLGATRFCGNVAIRKI